MSKIKKIIISILFLLSGVSLVLAGSQVNRSALRNIANTAGEPNDLIGTRVGTTTTGIPFAVYGASSTYPFRIDSEVDEVTVLLNPVLASTTAEGGGVIFSMFQSNDFDCDTASTTATLAYPIKNEITWYDAMSHLNRLAGSLSNLSNGTTTLFWPLAGSNTVRKEVTLTNLNTRCLMLEITASGTVLYAEYKAK